MLLLLSATVVLLLVLLLNAAADQLSGFAVLGALHDGAQHALVVGPGLVGLHVADVRDAQRAVREVGHDGARIQLDQQLMNEKLPKVPKDAPPVSGN